MSHAKITDFLIKTKWDGSMLSKKKCWNGIFGLIGSSWHWRFVRSDLKMNVSIEFYIPNLILIPFVIGPFCNILIRWPYLTWPWYWPLHSIMLLFTWHITHALRGTLAIFGFALLSFPCRQRIRRKGKVLTFDLTLILFVTSLRNFSRSPLKYLLKAFDCNATSPDWQWPLVRQLRSGQICPPAWLASQWPYPDGRGDNQKLWNEYFCTFLGRVWPNTPAGRGLGSNSDSKGDRRRREATRQIGEFIAIIVLVEHIWRCCLRRQG